MPVSFDFDGRVALVTGACGALGSAVVEVFRGSGATVAAVDVIDPDDEDSMLYIDDDTHFYRGDLTDESDVRTVVDSVVSDHGRIDFCCNVAGTWRGGTPIDETSEDDFDFMLNVNLKTAFLTSKHCLPHLRETEGSIISVSARSSLEGGEGDGPYRISKAGIRILTETIAEENPGEVNANCVMPSVLDTPMNREMMTPSDDWVEPAAVAQVMAFLCSDAAKVTSGAAIPVYGEA